jgi:uncharacterized RDD family membrane protein YckC
MASFLYEGVLMFGVVMIAGYLFSSLTQQRHALQGTTGLQAFLFVVIGIYFVWFWARGGQTVAMKTWNIRLERSNGRPVPQWLALCRYLLCWLWFLPALATAWWSELRGAMQVSGLLLANVAAYAMLARLHPQGQFLHDALCGTRLVDSRAPLARD